MTCVFPGNRSEKQRKKKKKIYHFLSAENKLYFEAYSFLLSPPHQVPDHKMILLLGNDKKIGKNFRSAQ